MNKKIAITVAGFFCLSFMPQLFADTIHITTLAQLQSINCSSSSNSYVLDNDIIPTTVTAINPICNNSNPFQGKLDGQNHVIGNLTVIVIDDQNEKSGFFGHIGGTGEVSNLNLSNITVTTTGGGEIGVGVLTGFNQGIIDNVTATNGKIIDPGKSLDGEIGGLVGRNDGTIKNSYANISVFAHGSFFQGIDKIGSFVGINQGSIETSSSWGNVTIGAYQSESVGGFVGENAGTGSITNCFAQGNVHFDSPITMFVSGFGGFAGKNSNGSGAVISYVYSLGSVIETDFRPANIGGLVGTVDSTPGGITSSFWNTQTSGLSKGVGSLGTDPAGVNGRTTALMQQRNTYLSAGWDINAANVNAIWDIFENTSYPFFRKQRIFLSGCIIATDNLSPSNSVKVKLAVNGNNLPDDAEISTVGDCYTFVVHKGDMVTGNALLFYLLDSGLTGNTIFIPNNDTVDISNVDIYTNRVALMSTSNFNNNYLFDEAKGNLTDGILYQTNGQGSFQINTPKLDVKVNGTLALSGNIGDGCKTAQEIAQRVFVINSPINPGTQYINAVDLFRYHAGSL